MGFWTGRRVKTRRVRTRLPVVEAVEGRALLSAVLPPPVVAAPVPLSAVPTEPALTAATAATVYPGAAVDAIMTATATSAHPRIEARHQALVLRRAERAARLAARHNPRPPAAQDSSSPAGTVGAAGGLAVSTAWKGYWLTHSQEVANVGLKYSRLAVAHDTRKVGYAYLHAALRGDTKTLDNLGHTPIVKKVGNEFSQLGRSRPVTQVGHKFTQFGKSVSDQFHRIFG